MVKCIVKKEVEKDAGKDVRRNNPAVLNNIAEEFHIEVQPEIENFLEINGGGYPVKDLIRAGNRDYEVRVFLSLDPADEWFNIEKPLRFFLKNTKGKIIPIGLDSGDNYYCVNNEDGKVYFWNAEKDLYFEIANDLKEFTELFV